MITIYYIVLLLTYLSLRTLYDNVYLCGPDMFTVSTISKHKYKQIILIHEDKHTHISMQFDKKNLTYLSLLSATSSLPDRF